MILKWFKEQARLRKINKRLIELNNLKGVCPAGIWCEEGKIMITEEYKKWMIENREYNNEEKRLWQEKIKLECR